MADHSFDIESKYSKQDLLDAIEQTRKELANRYDFRDTKFEIEYNEKDHQLLVLAGSDYQLKALIDTLLQRAAKRGIAVATFDLSSPPEKASGESLRQKIKLIAGISSDIAKEITKLIRDNFKKSKGQIQGETVRVVSPSIDELQAIQNFLREEKSIKIPLQFANYR